MNRRLLLPFVLLVSFSSFAQIRPADLRCEDRKNPLGIDAAAPRLSWKLTGPGRNIRQTAWEVRVLAEGAKSPVWQSGRQAGAASVFVPYAGEALKPATVYTWQVRVWDGKGRASAWSEPARWQTGLSHAAGWTAKWIGSGNPGDTVDSPPQLYRKSFSIHKKILRATAFVTAHGMYELYANGKRVGDACFAPGWTVYAKRLQYQAYDLTSFLTEGKNGLGVAVGSGWYRTHLGWSDNPVHNALHTALLAQIEIAYADGSTDRVITDGSWRSGEGEIRMSELYAGETIDHRKAVPGWATAGFDDGAWRACALRDEPMDNIIATVNEPVRPHHVFKPVRIFRTPNGEQMIDFGQNLVGWAQITASGKAGDSIVVDHAEVMNKDGSFYNTNYRAAKSQNVYILKGGGAEEFAPHFTFQGFRFIRLTGYPGEVKPENISAVALYSDMDSTGDFSCSEPLLNQLQHNIRWGQRGNFLDVPTDCPQRDERLGWTGDAQAFSRTASFNMNVHNFFTKWLQDVAADQFPSGSIPFVVPNVLGPDAGGSTGWADVCTIVPWNMYLAYGDRQLLANQYESMKKWVGYMESKSEDDLWNTGFHFGDWLFYRPFDDNDGRSAVTDKYLIAQCFFAHSTQLVLNAARVLGHADDVKKYEDLLARVKAAFLKEYVTPSGRLVSGTQTADVLALQFDMLPENLRAKTAARLAENVADYDDHLTTGFLGTPYLCHTLSRFGYDSVAYKLLLQKTYPSWLYPVTMGATTIWERWDGQKPDSTFQTPGMNSFNHYAYGAIGDWMYRYVAGIDTESDTAGVGYKKIVVRPHPGGGLAWAGASLVTAYGTVASRWQNSRGAFVLDVTIPPNTDAQIFVPAEPGHTLTEGGKPLAAEYRAEGNGGAFFVPAGSGNYHFVVQ